MESAGYTGFAKVEIFQTKIGGSKPAMQLYSLH